ncbi:kinase domain protein [Rhizoctonia solani]|uniref:Kinase domain protein n=1 Tax=Rhizoctonia solani TaxID=456999 RepID=A0A8H8SYB9_9AGAM|nr:kinase domain protein [Rhizoctonia solani]QRW22319.1 kinase domain protein [Rhizoctonia solani]
MRNRKIKTLEKAIKDKILHDPNFFEHFLSGPPDRLDTVLKYCQRSGVYVQRKNHWNPNTRFTRSSGDGTPLLRLLNTIVRGVHSMTPSDPNVPLALFLNRPTMNIPEEATEHDLPDYLLFDGTTRGWQGVRTAVKVMTLPEYRKMGMRHLSICAAETFKDQIDRRHIYSLMVCGTEATFVRFDRAGILYSSAIDLCKNAETFIRAFTSLMILDRVDEGYDPYFSTKLDSNGSIVYYLDLPIESGHPLLAPAHVNSSTRKFQVKGVIYRHPEIAGNGTTVLRLCEVLKPIRREIKPKPRRGKGKKKRIKPIPVEEEQEERIGDTSYILKIAWRDTEALKEADIYEEVDGMYGLVQYIWARDIPRPCTCTEPEAECPTCVVEIAHIDGLETCDNLANIQFPEASGNDGKNKEGSKLDTSQYRPAPIKRRHYIYSYGLMSSVGVPLETAKNPEQFMNAMLDAVLGYWRLFNLGYIHRDISEGNILMLEPGQKFVWREWENPGFELSDIEDEDLRQSEEKLRKVIAELDRDPVGVLIDYDLCVRHSADTPVETKSETEFHACRKRPRDTPLTPCKRQRRDLTKCYSFRDTSEPPGDGSTRGIDIDYRVGTSSFMSASALGSTYGKPYRHSYLDDIESFFWSIYLLTVSHAGNNGLNEYQDEEIKMFDDPSMKKLADYKAETLSDRKNIFNRLGLYENKWAYSAAFSTALFELEDFVRETWEEEDPGMTPAEAFDRVTTTLLDAISNPHEPRQ